MQGACQITELFWQNSWLCSVHQSLCLQVCTTISMVQQRASLVQELDECQVKQVQALQKLEASQQTLRRAEEHQQLLESIAESWQDADSGDTQAACGSTAQCLAYHQDDDLAQCTGPGCASLACCAGSMAVHC